MDYYYFVDAFFFDLDRYRLHVYRYGDANLDNLTDGGDYIIWADHYLSYTQAGPAGGDFNRDFLVDGGDYTIWADHYSGSSATLPIAAVPEPSSLLLGLAAMGAFGAFIRWTRFLVPIEPQADLPPRA